MNRGRKIVTSVALGAAWTIVASAVVAKLNGPSAGGWFMYAPNSTSLLSASDRTPLSSGAVWLTAVAIWFVVSWRLFRSD